MAGETSAPEVADDAAVPSLAQLFGGFFSIGISGFGGVLPWARRMVVEQKNWLDAAEFNDLLALCQFLPGPNIVNFSVALGSRFHGVRGAATCCLGLLAAPFCIVILLGVVYDRTHDLAAVAHGFHALAAAASGLVLSMALKLLYPLRQKWRGLLVVGAGFIAIALFRLPLLPTMVALVPFSLALAWTDPT